jgi:hypothetical protein
MVKPWLDTAIALFCSTRSDDIKNQFCWITANCAMAYWVLKCQDKKLVRTVYEQAGFGRNRGATFD